MASGEQWSDVPEDHDFPAAATYLSLVCDPTRAGKIVDALRAAPNSIYDAKDLLRASRLPLLPKDNFHVQSDLAKVKNGKKLSPILLVRGNFLDGRDLVVADGYHRICASYWIDENSPVPCRIVDPPA